MKYVIMADGKGKRWNNYDNIPKHFVVINGEMVIQRVVRLIRKFDKEADVIITSHDPRYEIEGARRYEPMNNVLEVDRFTEELIEDNMCFLYGDTYYSEEAMQMIVDTKVDDIQFFGNGKSIVAIKITDSDLFRYHVQNVRNLFLKGEIKQCIGWQVYQSFLNLPFDIKQVVDKYIYINDNTQDFNTPDDLKSTGRI